MQIWLTRKACGDLNNSLEKTLCFTYSHSFRFWLFEARNSPDTAPLVVWLNGGVRSAHHCLDNRKLMGTSSLVPPPCLACSKEMGWVSGVSSRFNNNLCRTDGQPCRINSDQLTVSLNPYSWNNNANMCVLPFATTSTQYFVGRLYIDQPGQCSNVLFFVYNPLTKT